MNKRRLLKLASLLEKDANNEKGVRFDLDVWGAPAHPPGPIQSAQDNLAELTVFLKETPVIGSFAEAKLAGGWIERTRIALKTMEDERAEKVAPLNEKLSTINGAYRAIRDPLTKAYDVVKARLTKYNRDEEEKRNAEAERLRQEAAEAERLAREAEAREQDAIACADVGECTDVGTAITEADAAFGDFKRADRTAAVAERQSKVRIPSMMGGKSISMRTVEVLTVTDACEAINNMGLTDKIRDAILSSARDFRKAYGDLPDGVSATQQRQL